MVLLAASVCSKDGKALISRQFVEMSKPRIEGLIATFPKLISSNKQHTFIETDSVRYVYRPLEKLFVLLITTKNSNILEDLETLRLFARVVSEYGGGTDEKDIIENAFEILFAFDEIVALGYAEHVNLSQIRTFIEMDSHEEKIFEALRETQEREAKENMKRKAKELQTARLAAMAKASSGGGGMMGSGGFGNSHYSSNEIPVEDYNNRRKPINEAPAKTQAGPIKTSKRGMQLGAANIGNVDSFVNKLKLEGEVVASVKQPSTINKKVEPVRPIPAIDDVSEDLIVRIEEKLTASVGRDGGLENMEVTGIMQVKCSTEIATMAQILVDHLPAMQGGEKRPPAQLQTHPNIDKKIFLSSGMLQTKQNGKPYPIQNEIGVLKWRVQTQDESMLPITLNCWPNEISGGFEVNIEYELQEGLELELLNVEIRIPLPASKTGPQVSNCEGEYSVDGRKTNILWTIPMINQSCPGGSLEFTIKSEAGSRADAFFPVNVDFASTESYCQMKVLEVTTSDAQNLLFSQNANFYVDKYEIV